MCGDSFEVRSSDSICAEYLSASLRLFESCAKTTPHFNRAPIDRSTNRSRQRKIGEEEGEGRTNQSSVHVEGVLLEAGDALGEPFVLVVKAVSHHRRRRAEILRSRSRRCSVGVRSAAADRSDGVPTTEGGRGFRAVAPDSRVHPNLCTHLAREIYRYAVGVSQNN